MGWVYRRLDPARSQASNVVVEILRGGFAWCGGYNAVVARLLQREGFAVKWVTMEAEGHPRGRGPLLTDTHEVLEVVLDGRPCVLDSMTNRCHAHPLLRLLRQPELAGPRSDPDARYRERGYELYDTAFWYERVARYCLRDEPDRDPCVWQPVAGRGASERLVRA
jgi:arylamine N-acetyltransferase